MAKLTEKQKRFVDEYLVDLNATQAAIRAGYSKKTANRIGTENLSKPVIQAELQKRIDDRIKRVEVTQDKVVEQLAKIAFADVKDFVRFGQREVTVGIDEEGNPITKLVNYVDFKQDHEVDGTLLSEVKIGRDGASMKLNDRMRALEMLGRHLGMFNDKIDLTGETTINITLVDDDDGPD